jgi:DNA-binding MarR family transcriptional regulator
MGSHTSANSQAAVRSVLDSIRRIVRALRLFDREAEKRAGLSAAQVFVLHHLRDGKAISINGLAARTHTDQSSVSVVAAKLAARKLLRRARGGADGRNVVVSITEKGLAALKSAPPAAQEKLAAAIMRLTPGKREQLANLLAELVRKTGLEDQEATLFFEDRRGSK